MEIVEDARLAVEFPEEAKAFKKLEEKDVLIELEKADRLRIKIIHKLEQAVRGRDMDILHRAVLEVLGMLR